MTRGSNQSHFYNISEFLIGKPSAFAHKEMSIFASVVIKLGQMCCFDCLLELCYILRIMCPQLAQSETGDFAVTEGSAGHNILTPCPGLM